MTFYFDDSLALLADLEADEKIASIESNPAYKALFSLHGRLFSQLQVNNIDLHLLPAHTDQVVTIDSVAAAEANGILTINYLRSRGQAMTIERLMGRDEVASASTLQARRHPVIELRLMPERFVVELILSPDAWWDQQNLAGKLRVARHRQDFYLLLRDLDNHFRMGFWGGTHLSEMHLSAHQFQHPRIMDEWMGTFEPGFDWWRMGVWYNWDDPKLGEDVIIQELLQKIRILYTLYQHILWTSDNNYRDFYDQQGK